MSSGDGMLALVYDKARDDWDTTKGFRKVEVPRPVLAQESDPEDAASAIVKVIYAGVCGSDRGIWFRQSFKGMIFESLRAEKKTWRVIGHEMVGEIVALGSYARSHYGLREKNIVAAESHIICGRCYQCRLGETHVCDDDRIIGISRDGCFAEYIKLPARVLWPTDDKKISLKVAAVQEPFGNAVHACTKVDMRGRTVAVFGCGPIGLFTILIARVLGASRVFGVEPDAQKREMAMTLGADDVFAPGALPASASRARAGSGRSAEAAPHADAPAPAASAPWSADREVVKSLRAATGGIGVDVSVEMAGYNSSVNSAIQSVRRGGDVVLFGLKSGDFTIEGFERLIVNGVTLHSVIGRQIFRTWYVTRGLLEDRSNGIQQKIYDVILRGATDTVVEAESFDPARFEAKLVEYPKLLLKF